MTALLNAIDNTSLLKCGENSHMEYGWSSSEDFKERLVQFNFQLTRTNDRGVSTLALILKEMLIFLKGKNSDKTLKNSERTIVREYLVLLYKIIASTRDIIDGKGECTLTYMMIHVWYEFYTIQSQ